MDIKQNIKERRQERIKELLALETSYQENKRTLGQELTGIGSQVNLQDKQTHLLQKNQQFTDQPDERLYRYERMDQVNEERDPEVLWKKGYRGWGDLPEEDPPRRPNRFGKGFVKRLVFSAILFGAIIGAFKWDAPFLQPTKLFIADSLHREMDFSAATVWYTEHFGGAPSFLPIFQNDDPSPLKVSASRKRTAPLQGTVAQPFAITMKGIEIVPNPEGGGTQQVQSIDAGRVIEVNNSPGEGTTVVIQHTATLTGIYGRLEETKVTVGSWVEEGDRIGQISAGTPEHDQTLYFALKEGDTYIDPTEVISFD
ncbi:M23 family metallopeptidase [Paenibacillus sp. Marseille-Q4541]|uniref:M23 family metallopeptidase n=1 Tax=Paenibacillus sp. Marseille-Q4541 TaxID=2831522 RepID=UPI001BA6F39F|nr:M23 family metallopeptidase [Paenibacillus sp. Marseille-Q4541]